MLGKECLLIAKFLGYFFEKHSSECRKNKNGGRTLSIITGYEVYLKRAERTGQLSGWTVTHEGARSDNTLKAIVTIHRKGWDHPFIHEVFWFEYQQNTAFWNNKPITMIKKVAMAQAFRLCFSDELGGMPYTSDEMSEEMELVSETGVSSVSSVSGESSVTTKESGDTPMDFSDDIPWKDDKKEEKSEKVQKTVGLTIQKRNDMIGVIEQVTDYIVNNKQWLPTYTEVIEYVDKLEIIAEKNWVKTGQDPIKFIDESFKAVVKVVDENKASQEQDLDIF